MPMTDTERRELEKLINPESLNNQHFNAKEIIKAEKNSKRKRSKVVLHEDLQQEFEIDVTDVRFKSVLEHHDFAVDPTNAK